MISRHLHLIILHMAATSSSTTTCISTSTYYYDLSSTSRVDDFKCHLHQWIVHRYIYDGVGDDDGSSGEDGVGG